MKSVLISIRPEWCELIASGKKTIEIRKNRPKLETPFKVYIYCTTDKHGWFDFGKKERLDGKVIGEFVCDRIDPAVIDKSKSISRESCVPLRDLWKYAFRAKTNRKKATLAKQHRQISKRADLLEIVRFFKKRRMIFDKLRNVD